MALTKRLKKVKAYRKALKMAKRVSRDNLLNRRLPKIYAEAATEPVDERKVIFFEDKLTAKPDAYTLLWKLLEERYDFDLRYVTLRHNAVRYKEYEANCEEFVRELATAKYVFLNDASDVVSCVPLRAETKVVQLWHACGAFKKWGMSTAELKFGGSRADLERHPNYKNLDLVTVSSPEVCWAYREAMVLEDTPDVVQPFGVSRTDVFFDVDFLARARDFLDTRIPACKGKKVILYAPTFRGRVRSAKGPNQLDIEALERRFGETHVLLVKHHPFVKRPPEIPESCESFAYQITGNGLPIDKLLAAADICITDYSSIVFEYSLLCRPMAFFAPDLSDYEDWRGFYYGYDELTPGPVFQDNEGLSDWIASLESGFDDTEMRAFKDRFMVSCDGRVTRRIAEWTFGDDLKRHRRAQEYDDLWRANPDGKDISIIVPTYNARGNVQKCLSSLVAQTYDLDRMEVIVVDDHSNDGTWEEVQKVAERYPQSFRVERLDARSGSPAAPRNAGLDVATGTYVFFVDADDWLGPQAVERMVRRANEWAPDVMLVKMKGERGRKVPTSMFEEDEERVDVAHSKVFWNVGPLKLYKRSFLEEHNLRFPTEGMPEDLLFVIQAMTLADKVSVASDYNYYHVSYSDSDAANLTTGLWRDIDRNMKAYAPLLEFVEGAYDARDLDEVLMRRLLRRDVLLMFASIARQEDAAVRKRWYDEVVGLFGPHYREDAYASTSVDMRPLLDAGFNGGLDALCELVARRDASPRAAFEAVEYDLSAEKVVAKIPVGDGFMTCDVTAGLRSKASVESYEWDEEAGLLRMEGPISASSLFALKHDESTASVFARHMKTLTEVAWPCTITWESFSADIEDDYPARGRWHAEIPALELLGAPLEAEVEPDEPEPGLAGEAAVPEETQAADAAALEETKAADAAAPEETQAADAPAPEEGAQSQDALPESAGQADRPETIPWRLLLRIDIGDLRKNARLRSRREPRDYPRSILPSRLYLNPEETLMVRLNRVGFMYLTEIIPNPEDEPVEAEPPQAE